MEGALHSHRPCHSLNLLPSPTAWACRDGSPPSPYELVLEIVVSLSGNPVHAFFLHRLPSLLAAGGMLELTSSAK